MYWRAPTSGSTGNKYAVDKNGAIIVGHFEGAEEYNDIIAHVMDDIQTGGEAYVTQTLEDTIRVNPDIENWGVSVETARYSGGGDDEPITIEYDGQTFVISADFKSFAPELQDYQPGG